MSASKLKNLILLILALCVAFLLAAVVPNRLEQGRAQRALYDQLTQLYEKNGLQLALDALPQSAALYAVELPDDGAQTAAKALLGENAVADDASTSFLRQYGSAFGTVCVSRDGAVTAELHGMEPVQDPEAAARKLAEAAGCQVYALRPAVRQSAGSYVIPVEQSLLGVPVFSHTLEFTFVNGALSAVSGTLCPSVQTVSRTSAQKSLSCADALVRFLGATDALGWLGASVTGAEQGYIRTETAASSARFVPVWRIATDSDSFLVNGLTGEVSRIGAE